MTIQYRGYLIEGSENKYIVLDIYGRFYQKVFSSVVEAQIFINLDIKQRPAYYSVYEG